MTKAAYERIAAEIAPTRGALVKSVADLTVGRWYIIELLWSRNPVHAQLTRVDGNTCIFAVSRADCEAVDCQENITRVFRDGKSFNHRDTQTPIYKFKTRPHKLARAKVAVAGADKLPQLTKEQLHALKPGDTVVVRDGYDSLKVGDVVELVRHDGTHCPPFRLVGTSGGGTYMAARELAFIPAKEADPVPEPAPTTVFDGLVALEDRAYREFKVGDRFVVVADEVGGHVKGSVYELAKNDGSNCPLFNVVEGSAPLWWGVSNQRFACGWRKLSKLPDTAPVVEPVQQPEPLSDAPHPEFKPGDKFIVLPGYEPDHTAGAVYELVDNDDSRCPFFKCAETVQQNICCMWYKLTPIKATVESPQEPTTVAAPEPAPLHYVDEKKAAIDALVAEAQAKRDEAAGLQLAAAKLEADAEALREELRASLEGYLPSPKFTIPFQRKF